MYVCVCVLSFGQAVLARYLFDRAEFVALSDVEFFYVLCILCDRRAKREFLAAGACYFVAAAIATVSSRNEVSWYRCVLQMKRRNILQLKIKRNI